MMQMTKNEISNDRLGNTFRSHTLGVHFTHTLFVFVFVNLFIFGKCHSVKKRDKKESEIEAD